MAKAIQKKRPDKKTGLKSPQISRLNKSIHLQNKDIDTKIVEMATDLATKMATALLREAVPVQNTSEALISQISNNVAELLSEKISKMDLIAPQSISLVKPKQEFNLEIETPDIVVDHSKGLTLSGRVGKTTTKEDSTDAALKALEALGG